VEGGAGTSPGIWIHPVEASSRPGAPFAGVLTYTSGTAAETSGDATVGAETRGYHGHDSGGTGTTGWPSRQDELGWWGSSQKRGFNGS
jgi:hypothetical protein